MTQTSHRNLATGGRKGMQQNTSEWATKTISLQFSFAYFHRAKNLSAPTVCLQSKLLLDLPTDFAWERTAGSGYTTAVKLPGNTEAERPKGATANLPDRRASTLSCTGSAVSSGSTNSTYQGEERKIKAAAASCQMATLGLPLLNC